jgi:hypothetical protein
MALDQYVWSSTLWTCSSFIFTDSSGNWPLFCRFRSSSYVIQPVPLPHFKSKVGHLLTKTVALRINWNIDGSSISSRSHTHPSHSQTSRHLTRDLVSLFRCSSPPHNPVSRYVRRVDPSTLALSLSSHRHSYTSILFTSHFLEIKNPKIPRDLLINNPKIPGDLLTIVYLTTWRQSSIYTFYIHLVCERLQYPEVLSLRLS